MGDQQIERTENELKIFQKLLGEKNIPHEKSYDSFVLPNHANEKLERELQSILDHRSSLSQQMRTFKDAEKQLIVSQQRFLLESNQFWLEVRDMDSEHARVKQRIRAVAEQLDMMKRTNVYDDAFHIYYDGHLGTISGLRLGRLDGQMILW